MPLYTIMQHFTHRYRLILIHLLFCIIATVVRISRKQNISFSCKKHFCKKYIFYAWLWYDHRMIRIHLLLFIIAKFVRISKKQNITLLCMKHISKKYIFLQMITLAECLKLNIIKMQFARLRIRRRKLPLYIHAKLYVL